MRVVNLPIVILILLGSTYSAKSQKVNTPYIANILTIKDRTSEVSFLDIGNAHKVDSATYTFKIAVPADTRINSAQAEVAVSNELFVNLPGTYGGRLFLNTAESMKIMKDIIFTDSVEYNQNRFVRQYWVTYAGMGLWEGVINCYLKRGERYYVVSMVQDESLGKPGEGDNFTNNGGESLKMTMLKSLMDSTSITVQSFNKLVASIKIANQ